MITDSAANLFKLSRMFTEIDLPTIINIMRDFEAEAYPNMEYKIFGKVIFFLQELQKTRELIIELVNVCATRDDEIVDSHDFKAIANAMRYLADIGVLNIKEDDAKCHVLAQWKNKT